MIKQQASWTHGYRAESEYPSGVHPELNPDQLLLTLALQGIRPASEIVTNRENQRSLVYCELGCGQGVTLNLMAARDPNGRYYGVDYNPNQVRNARAYAKEIGNSNVTFSEESFADLDKYDIPECDVIVLHGIWSWINAEMRQCILAFIRRKLKPGGVVYNSYNCSVGFSAMLPMRKLLLAAERTTTEPQLDKRVSEILDLSMKMAEADAKYFRVNSHAVDHIKNLPNHKPAYVQQEYLNDNWNLFYHDEVAAQMAEAKMNFAGSANMINNRPELALPSSAAGFKERLSAESDIELLKDLWTNNTFRKDLYARGIQKMSTSETVELLSPLLFGISRPRDKCDLKVQIPVGSATLPEKPYAAILDAIAEKPLTGAEIKKIIEESESKAPLTLILGTLVALNFIQLCPADSEKDKIESAIDRIEAANKKAFTNEKNSSFGVLPGMRGVVNLNSLQYFFWQATKAGVEDAQAWVAERLKETNRALVKDGAAVTDPVIVKEILQTSEAEFNTAIKPLMYL